MSDSTTSGGAPVTPPAQAIGAGDLHPFTGAGPNPNPETFLDKLKKAAENLADVTVATLITEVTVGVDERGRLNKVTASDQQVSAVITNINLVDGNVTTVMAPDLKDDTALTTFHQAIVDKAVKVLPDNLNALITVVKGLIGAGK
jgi:hypothetical protein